MALGRNERGLRNSTIRRLPLKQRGLGRRARLRRHRFRAHGPGCISALYAAPDAADLAADLRRDMYYEEGNPAAVLAPDVMVVDRGAEASGRSAPELQAVGGAEGPDFILEVASRSTWPADRDEKRAVYASLGVEEYWLNDPTGERFTTRLRGMRLVEGRYRALAALAPGSFRLAVRARPESGQCAVRNWGSTCA